MGKSVTVKTVQLTSLDVVRLMMLLEKEHHKLQDEVIKGLMFALDIHFAMNRKPQDD